MATVAEPRTLTQEHRAYLNRSAITDPVLEAAGVYSTGTGIVFPYRDGNTEALNFRPDQPTPGAPKYMWPKDVPLLFNVLRDSGRGPVLVVEGTKQTLAVASWAPPEYAVYGMNGCWGWSKCSLDRFEDRTVFIVLDGDAAESSDVYTAGARFAEALTLEDAEVSFVRLPVQGKEGADDWLASLAGDRRTSRLAKLISRAQSKPADRKPAQRSRTPPETPLPDTGDRPGVAVNLDRQQVINGLLGALKDGHDAKTLFDFGGALTRVKNAATVPLDNGSFLKLLADTVATFHYVAATDRKPAVFTPAWPDSQTISALLSAADEFSPLSRIVRTPFIRPDGTVCSAAGYDRETRSMVVLGPGMDAVQVPEHPSQDDAKRAVKLLLGEWLGDLEFKGTSDWANALALVLTPFIRGSVPTAPMAVISGLQMGVGKNLLADCISALATGTVAEPMAMVDDEDELRKQVTAVFRTGRDIFVFDEAHEIGSKTLARALTAHTWTDRILGVSRMVDFPNQVTWMALGNKVQVNGDTSRRVYWITLHPAEANPQDRGPDAFRHADLRQWTLDNRPELVSAALTVIRAWFAADRPAHNRGSLMGSFEAWDRMLSGITAYAGVDGFLTDLVERRSESDFTTGWWTAHLSWLGESFGADEFIVSEVKSRALAAADFEAPPERELSDPGDKGWTRRAGQAYAKIQDRWFGRIRLVKSGLGHRSTVRWRVETKEEGDGGMWREPPTPPYSAETHTFTDGARVPAYRARGEDISPSLRSLQMNDSGNGEAMAEEGSSVGFDIETADADKLYRGDYEGPFVRLGGSVSETSEPETTARADHLLDVLNDADEIYGHNIFRFDLPALTRHAGADFDALAGKAVDTAVLARLVDPPTAKGMKAGYYSLDAVAARYGVPGKTDDLKGLAKEFGGYDKIPADDARYAAYLEGDLEATRAVYGALKPKIREAGLEDYARREMKVAAIQNRMTLNGFRIDEPLLAERVQAEGDRRKDALRILSSEYGIPLDREVTRGRAGNKVTSREPVLSPLGTKEGKEALVAAFRDAGAAHHPMTATGGLATSSDALGEGFYFVGKGAEMRKHPGMLRAYPDLPEVRRICELVSTVTGATAKYAEIAKYVVGGRVHPGIGEDQASGRWAMTRPSVTNLGKRGGKVVQRAVFLPEEGHVIVSADFSQVDMRAVAGLCQDPLYMAMFEPGKDMHTEIAAMMGVPRDDAKPLNHGNNYGLGAKAMILQGHDPELVAKFFEAVDKFTVKDEWTRKIREIGAAGELLDNGFGRKMRCDPKRAYTQAPALMGQGAARDIMTEGLLRMVERLPDIRSMFRAVVHDEVVLSVPMGRVEEVTSVLQDSMTFDFRDVPVLADISAPGENWAAAYSK